MEKRVVFHEGMDVDPADHTNLQTYVQDSLDHVVSDTLTASQRYAGFAVSKTGISSVSVAAGRLYSGGKRYAKDAATAQDFITALPIAGKKIVSVVVWGQEQDTNVVPREFLINEETGAAEPRAVAMTKARLANIQFAQGADAPDPTAPIIDAGYTRVANITLSTTGVDKIEMVRENAVENLDEVGNRTDALELFEAEARPKISTLASDLAKLANQLKGSASTAVMERMLQRLAVLESKDNIPASVVDSYADYFLDDRYVNLAHPNSHCKLGEGVRFPDYNASVSQIQIFDPLNPKVSIKGGTMMPAYDRQIWIANTKYAGETQIAGYSYQSFEMVEKTMSRQRVRYGSEFTVCTNAAFWRAGVYDYLSQTFKRGNETFKIAGFENAYGDGGLSFDAAGNGIVHSNVRLRQVFTDTVQEPYWDRITVPHTVNGAQVAETFLQGQDIWLDAIGLYFTRLANTGSVTVSICEVNKFGTPNLESVISHTTLDRNQLQAYPVETVVGIQPVFLQAGKRYAILLTTAADHWVGTTRGEDFTSGTFFYVLDGAYAQGDGTRDLMFKLYRAKFKSNRTVVEFGSLSLAGGILSIDINVDAIAPGSTQLTYEIQPAGSGTWYNLLDVTKYMLGQGGSTPVVIGFRGVFTGSVDMMPAMKLSGSEIRISRPDTTRTQISDPFTLPASSNNIHVIERYEGWDAAHHTAGLRLRTGTGYNTMVNPTAFSDEVGIDEYGQNYVERHYVFALGTAVTSYCIQHNATTDTPLLCFHTAWMKTYGL